MGERGNYVLSSALTRQEPVNLGEITYLMSIGSNVLNGSARLRNKGDTKKWDMIEPELVKVRALNVQGCANNFWQTLISFKKLGVGSSYSFVNKNISIRIAYY